MREPTTVSSPHNKNKNTMIERAGCFVFCVQQTIRHDGRVCFAPDQLVAVDIVRGHQYRLADGSGWLNDDDDIRKCLQPMPVQTGLWSFYINHDGQALRKHPTDNDNVVMRSKQLFPFQKVYCDRHVQHPITEVNYYRVQGTSGWIMDRRYKRNGPSFLLLPANSVQAGVFCFQALTNVTIRKTPTEEGAVPLSYKTLTILRKGQLVAVDLILQSQSSSHDSDDMIGPFLRLADGSGWLVERENKERKMQPIAMRQGSWELQVRSANVVSYRHPGEWPNNNKHVLDVYAARSLLQADYEVEKNGYSWYHVQGTSGWVCAKNREKLYVDLLCQGESTAAKPASTYPLPSSSDSSSGWSMEFVRGVAATVDGISEVSATDYSHHPNQQVVSFRMADDILIHVYCATRTVVLQPPRTEDKSTRGVRCHRNCTPKQLMDQFKCDLVELLMMRASNSQDDKDSNKEQEKDDDGNDPKQDPTSEDKEHYEEELRNHLLLLDQEIEQLAEKRYKLLQQILQFDVQRARVAQKAKLQDRRLFHNAQGKQHRSTHDHALQDSSPRSCYSSKSVQSRVNQLLLIRSEETDGVYSGAFEEDTDGIYSEPFDEDVIDTETDDDSSNTNEASTLESDHESSGSETYTRDNSTIHDNSTTMTPRTAAMAIDMVATIDDEDGVPTRYLWLAHEDEPCLEQSLASP